jgi:hypothetical protein
MDPLADVVGKEEAALVRGREQRGKLGRHPWVFFNGWLFGRHARDLALATDNPRLEVEDKVASTGLAVSVVIPTHNRAESLPLVLRRLMAQGAGADRFEVIVVDSLWRSHAADARGASPTYANLTRSLREVSAAARGTWDSQRKPLILLLTTTSSSGPIIRQVGARIVNIGRILLGQLSPWDDSTAPSKRYLHRSG